MEYCILICRCKMDKVEVEIAVGQGLGGGDYIEILLFPPPTPQQDNL